MKTELKETMINKGDKIICLKTITMSGIEYFTKGKEYISPENNCLTNNLAEDNFVQQSFLPNFFE